MEVNPMTAGVTFVVYLALGIVVGRGYTATQKAAIRRCERAADMSRTEVGLTAVFWPVTLALGFVAVIGWLAGGGRAGRDT